MLLAVKDPGDQHGLTTTGSPMPLIALLVVLGLAGLLMGRLARPLSPRPGAIATPAETTRGVQQATDAAAQAEQQRRDAVMKLLR